MRDAIVKYIITLKDRRKEYSIHRDMATNRADYDVAIDFQGGVTAIGHIITELEGFVKSGGHEDLMKQALNEAYGPPLENAGKAMVEAAEAAGLKGVQLDKLAGKGNYAIDEAGNYDVEASGGPPDPTQKRPEWEREVEQDADQPDPYGEI